MGVAISLQRVGSMLTVFFSEQPIRRWQDAERCDTKRFGLWHRALLERGVYWPPSQYEAAFISLAHTSEVFEITEKAAIEAFKSI